MSILAPALVLSVVGLILGLILGVSAKKFAVPVDARVTQICEALPGANCGGCGFTGCNAYAQAIVNGAPITKCAPGGASCAAKIAEIMGCEAQSMERQVAWVACGGTDSVAIHRANYMGITDCRSASVTPGGGTKACQQGCLGFGTCVKVCNFGAISVRDGIAVVDEERCTACKACINACPRALISLIPKAQTVRVACNNPDKGPGIKVICTAGCIGCTICAKLSPDQAIVMDGNLPKIMNPLCEGCALSVTKCPTKALVGRGPCAPTPKVEKEKKEEAITA